MAERPISRRRGCWPLASHDGCASRRTARLAVRVGEAAALLGNAIDVGRAAAQGPVVAYVLFRSEGVGDVRLAHPLTCLALLSGPRCRQTARKTCSPNTSATG